MKKRVLFLMFIIIFTMSIIPTQAAVLDPNGIVVVSDNTQFITHVKENIDSDGTVYYDVDFKIHNETTLIVLSVYISYDVNKVEFVSMTPGNALTKEFGITKNTKNYNTNTDNYFWFDGVTIENTNPIKVNDGEEGIIFSMRFKKIPNSLPVDEKTFTQKVIRLRNSTITSAVGYVGKGYEIYSWSEVDERFKTVFVPSKDINNIYKIEDININYNSDVAMIKGTTSALTYEVIPSYATDKNVSWTATGSVSVNENGLVSANDVGEGTVTVTSVDGAKTASVKITVQDKEVLPNNVEIAFDKTDINVGDLEVFKASVLPQNATDKSVTWSVDNENAIINPKTGMLKALKDGKVKVIATASNKTVGEYEVTIHPSPKLNMTPLSASVIVNENLIAGQTYKCITQLFDANYLPLKETGIPGSWDNFYYIEYSDNFADKNTNGISRDKDVITIDKTAKNAEGLVITATLKKKSNNDVVMTSQSNPFSIKQLGVLNGINLSGCEIIESKSENASFKNVYTIKATDAPTIITPNSQGSIFMSYKLNDGRYIKCGEKIEINPSTLKEGNNEITVLLFSSDAPGIYGYNMALCLAQAKITITK